MIGNQVSQTPETTDSPEPTSLLQWLATPRPGLVKVTMLLVALQAIGFAGYTLFGLVQLVRGDFEYFTVIVSVLVFTSLMAAILLAAVKGLGNARPWVRGLIITFQLLGLLVGVSLIQGGIYGLAVPLLIWVIAILILMFSRGVNAYVGPREFPFADQD